MSKRPKNPRSLRTALKYGWWPVTIKPHKQLSYMGMLIVIDRMIQGRYVANYTFSGGGDLAFENSQDAVMVSLRFG